MLCKDKPAVSEYVPAGHGAHIAAAEEVAPVWPYLPAAHKEPEHVAAAEEVAPVSMYLYIYDQNSPAKTMRSNPEPEILKGLR